MNRKKGKENRIIASLSNSVFRVVISLIFFVGICIYGVAGFSVTAEAATSESSLLPTAIDNLTVDLISNSELVVTDDGYMRVYYDGEKIGIEYYDEEFNVLSKQSLEMELSIWGGFYAGTDAYYIVEGQNNTAEDNEAEVIRVIKYSLDWERLGAAQITSNPELFGGEVRYPFDCGCVEMTEYNGMLYVVTGHESYVDDSVGQGHQGFLMIAVDEASMTGEIVMSDCWHSFAQYIELDGTDLYVLEQSEGSRCTSLMKTDAETLNSSTISVLDYGGERTSSWAVACYASVDDLAISSNNVLCVGTSIDQSLYDDVTSDTPHNIYLTVTPKSNFTEDATSIIWLTDYSDGGKSFLGVKLTKINDDRFLIMWEETDSDSEVLMDSDDMLSCYTLHYLFVDGSGNIISEEFTAAAPISACQPIVNNSQIIYYASSSNMVNFYTIDAETGEFNKKTYHSMAEDIAWKFENGVLTFSGSGALEMNVDMYYRMPVSTCGGVSIYYDGDYAWRFIRGEVTSIVIGDGITALGDEAFYNYVNVTSVTLPDSLQSIGSETFYCCLNLEYIIIPDSVVSIGEGAFWTGYVTYDWENIVIIVIYCGTDTAAEEYAIDNGISYRLLNDDGTASVNLSDCYVEIDDYWLFYDGTAQTPEVIVEYYEYISNSWVTLKKNTDYLVSYSDNVNAGTATVTITAKGNNCFGKTTSSFTIFKGMQFLDVTYETTTVVKGKTIAIEAECEGGTITFSSSNTSIATVNSKGVVTGKSPGTVTITITANGGDNYDDVSETLQITVKLATPTIKSISNTSSGVKLTWGAVSGAAKYQIWRKTSSGSWMKLGTTTSTSYTDKTAKGGTTYSYRLRCVKSDGTTATSSYSSSKSIKRLANAKISSLTNTSSGITVKWGKITGATGYYIYRKAGSGSYSKVKTITSGSTVSYTDTAVKSKNGTTYTYYVIPYYKNSSGAITKGTYSNTKKTVRLTSVSISSLKNSSSKKMTVKWAKNSKATGYQIQYSTSSSFASGNKTVTVSSASTVSKVISSLTKGKTYYVRIRTYKTVSGTKYYSAWSSKKSVKISK